MSTSCARRLVVTWKETQLTLTPLPPREHLLHDLQRFPDESRNVGWLSRRDQVAIDDDLLVDHVGARLPQVALDGLPRRHPVIPLARLVGRQQELRAVADGEDRPAGG